MVPMENGLATVAYGAISVRIFFRSPGVDRIYSICQYPTRFAFTRSAHRSYDREYQSHGRSKNKRTGRSALSLTSKPASIVKGVLLVDCCA